MPSQQLLLCWKDHNGALVSVFENLLKKNTLVDCTLAAEGQYLKAHKVVLSACSSYFELLFSQESEKYPIVILKDVKFQELEAAVNFMYRGEVEVCENRLAAFLEVADSLQIKGLGSDGKGQRSKEKSSSAKGSNAKSAESPLQLSREDAFSSHNDSADRSSNVPADCELVRNNGSSLVHQLSRSKSSRSSPSRSHASSASRSGSNIRNDNANLENIQRLSTALPKISSGENDQLDIKPVVKAELVTDTYGEEKCEGADRDYGDDITMMDDEEDWDEHNEEHVSDEHSPNQQDLGFTSEHMKTEDGTSENVEGVESGNQSSLEGTNWIQQDDGENFSSIYVKDEPSTSGSWYHQESCNEINPSAGTSEVSAGAELVVSDNHQQTRGSSLIRQLATGSANLSEKSATSAKSRGVLLHPLLQSGDVELNCPKCDLVFCGVSALKRHMLEHNSNRVYKCPMCNFIAQSPSFVKRHLVIHTGEKAFQCGECGSAFNQPGNLIRHKRQHTGEKPFSCTVCNSKFTRRAALLKHKCPFATINQN